ncbi:MAG: hypothetical protein ACKOC1_05070 [Hyphomicrobiales bacterium]
MVLPFAVVGFSKADHPNAALQRVFIALGGIMAVEHRTLLYVQNRWTCQFSVQGTGGKYQPLKTSIPAAQPHENDRRRD